MYQLGLGVTQDYKEAAKFCRVAAELGYTDAEDVLGSMYFRGEGVTQDYKEAAKVVSTSC